MDTTPQSSGRMPWALVLKTAGLLVFIALANLAATAVEGMLGVSDDASDFLLRISPYAVEFLAILTLGFVLFGIANSARIIAATILGWLLCSSVIALTHGGFDLGWGVVGIVFYLGAAAVLFVVLSALAIPLSWIAHRVFPVLGQPTPLSRKTTFIIGIALGAGLTLLSALG